MEEKYICFTVGSEQFAIPLLQLREVIKQQDITPVPQMPNYVLGIINLRGQIISIMDLRRKLGYSAATTAETAIMILNFGEHVLGVVVDSVDYVQTVKKTEIQEKPAALNNLSSQAVVSVFRFQESIVLILDIAKALSVEELNHFRSTAEAA